MLNPIEVMSHPRLAFILSCILGFGLASCLRPLCKGPDCLVMRGPEIATIKDHVYQMGDSCYEFTIKTTSCPADRTGLIKTFSFADVE